MVSASESENIRSPHFALDPNDPMKHMYDVDDESTVITLAEWYHNVAPAIDKQILATHEIPYVTGQPPLFSSGTDKELTVFRILV